MRNFLECCLYIAAIIFLVVITYSCATGSLMRFQDRELIVHPDKPGLAYPHIKRICKDSWLGQRCKDKHIIDFYDFNDLNVRQRLIDAGFSCTSKMRFKY